ncbi:unnamed protein product [Choristocarpus tenellus]
METVKREFSADTEIGNNWVELHNVICPASSPENTYMDPFPFKWKIFEAVSKRSGLRAFASYWDRLSGFIQGELTRDCLDEVIVSCLGEENVPLHNELILCLINNAHCSVVSAELENHVPAQNSRQALAPFSIGRKAQAKSAHLPSCNTTPAMMSGGCLEQKGAGVEEGTDSVCDRAPQEIPRERVDTRVKNDRVPATDDGVILLVEMEQQFGHCSDVWSQWADDWRELDSNEQQYVAKDEILECVDARSRPKSLEVDSMRWSKRLGSPSQNLITKRMKLGADATGTHSPDKDRISESLDSNAKLQRLYSRTPVEEVGPGYLPQRIPGSRMLAPLLQATTANKQMRVTHEVCRVMTASIKEYARRVLEACVRCAKDDAAVWGSGSKSDPHETVADLHEMGCKRDETAGLVKSGRCYSTPGQGGTMGNVVKGLGLGVTMRGSQYLGPAQSMSTPGLGLGGKGREDWAAGIAGGIAAAKAKQTAMANALQVTKAGGKGAPGPQGRSGQRYSERWNGQWDSVR